MKYFDCGIKAISWHEIFYIICPTNLLLMTEQMITSNEVDTRLTVIGKKELKKQAKLISLVPPDKADKVLLPPQPEKYIKAKKHDFL